MSHSGIRGGKKEAVTISFCAVTVSEHYFSPVVVDWHKGYRGAGDYPGELNEI